MFNFKVKVFLLHCINRTSNWIPTAACDVTVCFAADQSAALSHTAHEHTERVFSPSLSLSLSSLIFFLAAYSAILFFFFPSPTFLIYFSFSKCLPCLSPISMFQFFLLLSLFSFFRSFSAFFLSLWYRWRAILQDRTGLYDLKIVPEYFPAFSR